MVTLASRSSGTLHFFSFFPCEVMRVVPRMCKLQKRGESLLNTKYFQLYLLLLCFHNKSKSMAKVLRKAFSARFSEEVWCKNCIIFPQVFKVRDWNLALPIICKLLFSDFVVHLYNEIKGRKSSLDNFVLKGGAKCDDIILVGVTF